MGTVKFNKVKPDDLVQYGSGLYLKYKNKWICLANNCKLFTGLTKGNGFRYMDIDGYIHHFYNENINNGIAYYEKYESYETVTRANSSVTYLVTEEDILKYSKDLYESDDAIRNQLDELNYYAELFSNNPYTNKRRVK